MVRRTVNFDLDILTLEFYIKDNCIYTLPYIPLSMLV
jgi:hypothetical protein